MKSLQLYGCHRLTDKGFNRLFQKLPNLETLDVAFCWWHEGDDLVLPAGLVHLDLHESKRLKDAALINLKGNDSLRTLNLFQCLVLTDRGLEPLEDLPELKSLNLGSIRALTDDGLEHLSGDDWADPS